MSHAPDGPPTGSKTGGMGIANGWLGPHPVSTGSPPTAPLVAMKMSIGLAGQRLCRRASRAFRKGRPRGAP